MSYAALEASGVCAVTAAYDATKQPALVSAADHVRLDRLEESMLASGASLVELPVVHRFTPGLYVREIFMPAGTLLTSRIHNTEHPYVVTKGRVSVFIPDVGIQHIEAPYIGVTKPGTRRVLYIHEDTTWLTFHPLVDGERDEHDLAEIEARIIDRREWADGMTAFEHYSELLEQQELDSGNLKSLPEQYEYGGAP